jgi:hypothetical protein
MTGAKSAESKARELGRQLEQGQQNRNTGDRISGRNKKGVKNGGGGTTMRGIAI